VGAVNFVFSAPEGKGQGFDALPLPSASTFWVYAGKRYGSAVIKHIGNKHESAYG